MLMMFLPDTEKAAGKDCTFTVQDPSVQIRLYVEGDLGVQCSEGGGHQDKMFSCLSII